MTEPDDRPDAPADRYRAEVARMTEHLEGDTQRNVERVAELKEILKHRGRELVEASEQHIAARVGNILAWEEALEILWVESWMTMRPFPKRDRLVSGDEAAERITAVEDAVAALRATVTRGPLGLPRPR